MKIGICGGFSAGGASDISRWQARSAQPPDLGGPVSPAPEGRRNSPPVLLVEFNPVPFQKANVFILECVDGILRRPSGAPDLSHIGSGGCALTRLPPANIRCASGAR